jgi:prepilin-type processing-associated H-X9-DG protein
MALKMYVQNHNDTFPALRPIFPIELQSVPSGEGWMDWIHPYLKSEQVLICPANEYKVPSYGYNMILGRIDMLYGLQMMVGPIREGQVTKPSNTILCYDCVNNDIKNNNLNAGCEQGGTVVTIGALPETDPVLNNIYIRRPKWAAPRHRGGSLICWVDGHVSRSFQLRNYNSLSTYEYYYEKNPWNPLQGVVGGYVAPTSEGH